MRGGVVRLVARCATGAGLLGAAILLAVGVASPTLARPDGFVRVTGTELTVHGQPWRFVGFNDYQMTSMPGGAYFCGRQMDDATLNAVLRDAKKAGATVIRTWFFQSYYDLNSQGTAVSPTWAAFDRVLDRASTYGLKVVPVLVNEWRDCEPSSTNKSLYFFAGGYAQPSPGYPLSFKTYATTVAHHYANSTQIAFWQIGNELQNFVGNGCGSAAETFGAIALRAFADDVTASIKKADPNHLVSLGTIGAGECGLSNADYAYVHAGAVDLCDYHDYGDVTQALPDDGYNRLAQRVAQCRTLDKPIVVTESGIAADVGADGQETGAVTGATLQNRAGFFQAKLTAAFTDGVAGYVLWEKEQDASNSAENISSHGLYEIGPDNLLHDPTNTVTATQARGLRG